MLDLDRSSVGCFFITQWAVLVAIAIPVFTTQLEKAREAVDEANIRDAYAVLTAAIITEETNLSANDTDKITYTAGTAASSGTAYDPPTAHVDATQQVTGWASGATSISVAGVSVEPSVDGWTIEVDPDTGVATVTPD